MLIAEVIVPQMFTAYAEDMGYLSNGLHQFQYFCEECDQAFASAWGKIPNSMSWYERGNQFCCPYCGKHHGENVAYAARKDKIPNKVRLTVKGYENLVVFEVSCDVVRFLDLFNVGRPKYKESFRFDIAKRTVLFSRENDGEIESTYIGNPFEIDVFKKSILGFFIAQSLANTRQKSELNRILKVLRETVHKKLEKRLGHKIGSMFVSPGQYHGTFLLPIFNIAYRLTFPDAANLSPIYRESPRYMPDLWTMYMFNDTEFMPGAMELSRKTDHVSALLTTMELPNKPALRREIDKNIFEVGRLAAAFKLCSNYDYALRLHTCLKKLTPERHVGANLTLCEFLKQMLPIYGEGGIVAMAENVEQLHIWDCIRLYDQLSDENRQAIITDRIKIKDLHDWMAKVHRRQQHKNLKFNVPDHIIKRLSMQTNRLKFFLPKESLELLEAGAELHNCVASYGQAVKDNSKWVVLVADDNGRLAACLEVNGKQLVQAKLDRNQPVSKDEKLNAEVIAWAKEANLDIKTSDVKLSAQEQLVAAC